MIKCQSYAKNQVESQLIFPWEIGTAAPFYRWTNQDTLRWSGLPKVTHLANRQSWELNSSQPGPKALTSTLPCPPICQHVSSLPGSLRLFTPSTKSPNGSVGFQVRCLWGISLKSILHGAGSVLTPDKAHIGKSVREFQQHRNWL